MSDILFRTPDYVFSYRTAGILIRDGKVLLQKPDDDEGYAIPGGHVAFGETNADTLIREYREECGAEIGVDSLCAVAEVFFPWGDKPCHQLCTYFRVHLKDPDSLPCTDTFMTKEHLEDRTFPVRFYWMPLEKLDTLLIYPPQIVPVIQDPALSVQHFIYREE